LYTLAELNIRGRGEATEPLTGRIQAQAYGQPGHGGLGEAGHSMGEEPGAQTDLACKL